MFAVHLNLEQQSIALSTKILYVSNSLQPIEILIYDAFGRLVTQKLFNNFDERSIPVNQLTDGYYFTKIYANKELIRTQKIIISN